MTRERFYPITSLHKGDLRQLFRDPATEKLPVCLERAIDALTDADMRHIASRLADAFCTCCYWDALKAAFDDCYSAVGSGETDAPPHRKLRAAEVNT